MTGPHLRSLSRTASGVATLKSCDSKQAKCGTAQEISDLVLASTEPQKFKLRGSRMEPQSLRSNKLPGVAEAAVQRAQEKHRWTWTDRGFAVQDARHLN